MQVNVTSDGKLQLSSDGKIYQPLSVDEIELLNNSIPAAQSAMEQVPIAGVLESIVYALTHTSSGSATATLSIQGPVLTMTANPDTFMSLENELLDHPNEGDTTFTYGPLTVTKTGA